MSMNGSCFSMEKKIKSGWRVKKEKEPEYAYGFQRRRRTDMRNRKQKIKYILLLCVFSMFLIASCKRSETGKTVKSKEVINAQWENAAHTPYGKYPELVTYTLGKIVGSNNANLPVKATYEDNAYTRYLKSYGALLADYSFFHQSYYNFVLLGNGSGYGL